MNEQTDSNPSDNTPDVATDDDIAVTTGLFARANFFGVEDFWQSEPTGQSVQGEGKE
jgi:hypothetical protein